jgi:hypothetical protein
MLETTELSAKEAREVAGIKTALMPAGFDPTLEYDKWGNVIVSETRRLPGKLFHEPSVQKVLKPFLQLFDKVT